MLNSFQHLFKHCHAELVSASAQHQHQHLTSFMKRSYHSYHVYILTNKPYGTLYIGVTGGLDNRMEQHRSGKGSIFTAKYNLKRLVYSEEFQYINDAIAREKQLKNWHRQWKINLIERDNPDWLDLYKPLDKQDPETSSG